MAERIKQMKLPVLGRSVDTLDHAESSYTNLRTHTFPSFDFLYGVAPLRQAHQISKVSPVAVTDSFSVYGPLLTRLVALNMLTRPLLATALRRDALSLDDDAGTLSLGILPFELQEDQLTWVPVRNYKVEDGGLPPSANAPNEVSALVSLRPAFLSAQLGISSGLGGIISGILVPQA